MKDGNSGQRPRRSIGSHLYLRIYLAVVAIIILFGVAAGGLWWLLSDSESQPQRVVEGVGTLIGELLPESTAPAQQQRELLEKIARAWPGRYTLLSEAGRPIVSIGAALQLPHGLPEQSGWFHHRGRSGFALPLNDQRWLLASPDHRHRQGRLFFLFYLALMAGVLALLVYPLVRSITQRLERLRLQVGRLAEGDLESRVEVKGRDEVAGLATDFNHAVERIRRLVYSHKELLANVSHELRTPLTRLRLAVELSSEQLPQQRYQKMIDEIVELDDLIEELLIASRLEQRERTLRSEPLDLLALAASEAAQFDIEVAGESTPISGDPALLRRLIRNLLSNATRHGEGSPIEITVTPLAGLASVTVGDRGPGIGAEDQQRIFEPFYQTASSQQRQQGSGLGLSLVRTIARRHGGDVAYRPRPGGGSLFEVTLPLSH